MHFHNNVRNRTLSAHRLACDCREPQLHLRTVKNSTSPRSLFRKAYRKVSGLSALVLAIEPLAQRAGAADAQSTSAVLGGSAWLLRVWKRMDGRARSAAWGIRRIATVARELPRRACAYAARGVARAGLFRTTTMSFRS